MSFEQDILNAVSIKLANATKRAGIGDAILDSSPAVAIDQALRPIIEGTRADVSPELEQMFYAPDATADLGGMDFSKALASHMDQSPTIEAGPMMTRDPYMSPDKMDDVALAQFLGKDLKSAPSARKGVNSGNALLDKILGSVTGGPAHIYPQPQKLDLMELINNLASRGDVMAKGPKAQSNLEREIKSVGGKKGMI